MSNPCGVVANGGPGSGRHKGDGGEHPSALASKASEKAALWSQRANTVSSGPLHDLAAKFHAQAAQAHWKASLSQDLSSSSKAGHLQKVNEHKNLATRHTMLGETHNANGQGRHIETGQYLPKTGASGKQFKSAAEKGYMSGLFGEEDDKEIEPEDGDADQDGRHTTAVTKEGYEPTSASQDDDWEDDQDTDGTRNALDKQGGEEPTISRKALKMADFITLPEGEEGTNCSNCRYQEGGVCQNNNLKGQKVNKHNCCAYWDSNGTLREWDTDTTNGFVSEDQRKFMWSQEPEIAEKWAHGEHTAESDHKMPEVSGPDVKGPLAAKERAKAKGKKADTENAKEAPILKPAGPNIGVAADSAEGKAEVTKYHETPLNPKPKGTMNRMEKYLLANCGGPGGTPGPCPGSWKKGKGEWKKPTSKTSPEEERDAARRTIRELKDPHGAKATEFAKKALHDTNVMGLVSASAHARTQTSRAFGSDSKEQHGAAAQAHEDVAKEYDKVADKNRGSASAEKRTLSEHADKIASLHRMAAAYHKHASVEATHNAWSDAAREAAAASRQAQSSSSELNAKSNPTNDDQHWTAVAHERAAAAHDEAATQAVKEGKYDSVRYHKQMARAHNEAAEGHREGKNDAGIDVGKIQKSYDKKTTKNKLEKYLIDNCGGEGGTPGPCADATHDKHAASAVKYSREAINASDKTVVKGLDSEAHKVSQAAYKQTTKTKSDDLPENHSIAAQSHRTAARLHQIQGDKALSSSSPERRAMAAQHLEAASAHRAAAAMHERAAGTRNNDSRSHEELAFNHFQLAQKAKESGNVDEAKKHMQAAKQAYEESQEILRNCGGQGGTPGPCPSGDKPDSGQIHRKLVHALTQHDIKESSKPGHNPYALGHYLKAASEVKEAIEAGHNVRDAVKANFVGRLLDKSLKAVGEPKATKEEHMMAGRPLPKKPTSNSQTDNVDPFLSGGSMNRTQRKIILSGLTANCSCQEDKAALNALSDEALTTLFINAGKKKKGEEDDEDEDEDDSEMEENGGAKAEGSNADVTGSTGFAQAGGKGTKDEYNKNTQNKRQSLKEWEESAPPEVVHNWHLVQQHVQQIKEQKARRLVANIANKDRQDIQFKKLMKKTPEELDELLGLMATHNVRTPAPPPIYLGQSVANAMKNDEEVDSDVLPLPSMNMLDEKASS